jgi:hypothetical protein
VRDEPRRLPKRVESEFGDALEVTPVECDERQVGVKGCRGNDQVEIIDELTASSQVRSQFSESEGDCIRWCKDIERRECVTDFHDVCLWIRGCKRTFKLLRDGGPTEEYRSSKKLIENLDDTRVAMQVLNSDVSVDEVWHYSRSRESGSSSRLR